MDLRLAHKEIRRIVCKNIGKYIRKKLTTKFPDAQWVLAVNYLAETQGIVQSRWAVDASHEGLKQKVEEWKPALENVLVTSATSYPSDRKPTSAIKRAVVVRKLLRKAWLEHVRGTPHEGKKQCFDLVKKGTVSGFVWWQSVAGLGIPFESSSVDRPEVSDRLYDYLVSKYQ